MIHAFAPEDMAWTFSNFYPQFADLMYDDNTDNWKPEFLSCMKALAIVAENGLGDCYSLDAFIDSMDVGMFTPYDGDGDYLDENGNAICGIWTVHKPPENAKYVMWFNK